MLSDGRRDKVILFYSFVWLFLFLVLLSFCGCYFMLSPRGGVAIVVIVALAVLVVLGGGGGAGWCGGPRFMSASGCYLHLRCVGCGKAV